MASCESRSGLVSLATVLLFNATILMVIHDHMAAGVAAGNNMVLVVHKICEQAESYDFCFSTLMEDPRSAAADDLHRLAILSIEEVKQRVDETCDKIVDVLSHGAAAEGVDKRRMMFCQSAYEKALALFHGAFEACNRRSYWEVNDWVRNATNKAIDCEDIYRIGAPIRVSPFSGDNHKVIKLAEIILIILDAIIRPH